MWFRSASRRETWRALEIRSSRIHIGLRFRMPLSVQTLFALDIYTEELNSKDSADDVHMRCTPMKRLRYRARYCINNWVFKICSKSLSSIRPMAAIRENK